VRHHVSSGSSLEPTVGFSRAVRDERLVFVSATAAIWPDGHVETPTSACKLDGAWRSSRKRFARPAQRLARWCERACSSSMPLTVPPSQRCTARPSVGSGRLRASSWSGVPRSPLARGDRGWRRRRPL